MIQEFSAQESFPELTLPYFEVSAGHLRETSDLELVAYAPIIRTVEERDSWEDYAANHRAWIEESLDVYDGKGSLANFTKFIYRRDSYGHVWQSSAEQPWLPMWQISPPVGIKEHINFDLFSLKNMDELFQSMHSVNGPALSGVMDMKTLGLESGDSTVASVDVVETLLQRPPKCAMMYPVHSTLQKQKSKIVGVLIGILAWDQYLKNVFSAERQTSVLVTIPSVDGDVYFYELTGEKATRVSEPEANYAAYPSSSAPLFTPHDVAANTTVGPTLTIYATKTYESTYYTWRPAIVASAVVIGFVLVILAFYFYDRYVWLRNDKLRGVAERTTALVSSLFPATVHDRLFNAEDAETGASKHKKSKAAPAKDSAKKFLADQVGENDENDTDLQSSLDEEQQLVDDEDVFFKSKPIADHFPETTIMFADLAGFTGTES
jgi:hypothetical protein